MDILTFAANAVFSSDQDEELCIPLTPTKGRRPVFGELTNTINLSPEKLNDSSSLRALFTAPTLTTPKTKAKGGVAAGAAGSNTPGSRSLGRGPHGKSLSSPSPGSEAAARTPKREGASPQVGPGGDSCGRSPLTPMSNLKLLTRIASMEESISSKKALFGHEKSACGDGASPTKGTLPAKAPALPAGGPASTLRRHNSDCLGQANTRAKLGRSTTLRKHPTSSDYPTPSSPGNLVMESVGRIPSVDDSCATRASEGSRKDKSLGLLSEKFLEHFPMEVSFLETPRRLVIDEVAAMLGTERRRVYDIINVLESLNMAARVQKNMYQWMGQLHLQETLGRLKALGHKLDVGAQLQALQHFDHDFKFPQRIKTSLQGDGEKTDTRREKSLGILCQKFLMLLLVSPEPHMISLDNAARMLVGEAGEDGERLRTRGRRLYDIANVLASLGLVRRVPTAKAFQYIGPQVEAVTSEEDTLGILHRHSLLPSRLGSSGGKENLVSSYGDHEVTPSNSVPPRTRSEDVSTSKQSRKIMRHPSLHDICQVAEVEREKLLESERLQRSRSSDSSHSGHTGPTPSSSEISEESSSDLAGFKPITSVPQSSLRTLLQRRFTNRTKIPIALTFQTPPQGDNESTHLRSPAQIITKHAPSVAKTSQIVHPDTTTMIPSPRNIPIFAQTSSPFYPVNTGSANTPNTCLSQNQQVKPVVVVKGGNRFMNNSQNQSRVMSVGSTATQGPQVIKLITRTGGYMQQEPSTVITVLPAGQAVSKITPQKHIVQSGRGFQQISQGIYTNGKKVVSNSTSSVKCEVPVQGKVFTEQRQVSSQPCTIYTVSRNMVTEKTFPRVNSAEVLHMPTVVQKYQGPSVQNGSTSESRFSQISQSQTTTFQIQNSVSKSGGMTTVRTASFRENSRSSPPMPNTLQTSNQASTWQPSPESSSTDSELEQIFGDSFKFTRPKILVQASSGQIAPHLNQHT
ncbi:putative transcription factor E2F7 [Penaeus vannamei]|uniref:Putative transcription factor E2F7 n=1 Tax=Penaeus vannamei TaxID=6689 RepID=A0A3R7MDN2_PENVA|nr:putative transcription factor E2F7 [Penaeus vannamei]